MKNITHFEKVSFEQFQKDILKNTKIKNKIEEMYDNIQLPKRATIGSAGYACNEGHIMIKISNLSFENKQVELVRGEAFVQGILLTYGKTMDDNTYDIRKGGLGSTNK